MGVSLSRIRSTLQLISFIEAASPTLKYPNATSGIKVSVLPNPSHLEAVNPIALGKTRAKQFSLLKTLTVDPADCFPGDKVMCVQLHGDSSFTGQGVVMEGLGLSECSLEQHNLNRANLPRQSAALYGRRFCSYCRQVSSELHCHNGLTVYIKHTHSNRYEIPE